MFNIRNERMYALNLFHVLVGALQIAFSFFRERVTVVLSESLVGRGQVCAVS